MASMSINEFRDLLARWNGFCIRGNKAPNGMKLSSLKERVGGDSFGNDDPIDYFDPEVHEFDLFFKSLTRTHKDFIEDHLTGADRYDPRYPGERKKRNGDWYRTKTWIFNNLIEMFDSFKAKAARENSRVAYAR